jgi:AcrR family transcriptional regulator
MAMTGSEPNLRSDADADGRERLLAATRELVFDQFANGMPLGSVFAHITPAAIAERAGVSRGLIYHHWPGDPEQGLVPMDRLLTEVLESVFDRSDDVVELVHSAAALPSEMGAMVRALTDHATRQMAGPTEGNAWRARGGRRVATRRWRVADRPVHGAGCA